MPYTYDRHTVGMALRKCFYIAMYVPQFDFSGKELYRHTIIAQECMYVIVVIIASYYCISYTMLYRFCCILVTPY